MQKRPILFVTIILVSFLRWAESEAVNVCPWTKVTSNGEAHYSFLRIEQSNGQHASPSVRLYHSVWSQERALVGCTWSDDAAILESYASLCQTRTSDFTQNQNLDHDISPMFDLCVAMNDQTTDDGRLGRPGKRQARSVDHNTAGSDLQNPVSHRKRPGTDVHRRVKRGFIVPGTLWCGSGNKAPSYDDLGVFSETDSCCREHDQCKHTILSFQRTYGVFNTNIFTMSHCDCDNRFRNCLTDAEDSISDVVGYTFFNLLKMNCFQFSQGLQCTERNWFGMCKETAMSLIAEVYPPTLYETTPPTDGDNVTFNATYLNAVISNATLSNGVAFSESVYNATTSTTDNSTNSTNSAHDHFSPEAHNSSSVPEHVSFPGTLDNSTGRAPIGSQDAGSADKQLSCDMYRDLDGCRFKILPKQKRYGLYNPEPRILYHCNCTNRLFQDLSQHRELTVAHTLLLEHVSPSCFLPQDCTVGKTCIAATVNSVLPQLERTSGADMEEGPHLQALRLKIRGPTSRRAKRKDRSVRLYKLCLRLTKPKLQRLITAHLHGAQSGLP